MTKPIIIIPASTSELISDHTYEVRTPRYHVYRAYVEAIKRSGGIPLLVTRPDDADIDQVVARADGLMLAGGTDIDPKRYGETDGGHCGMIDHERDRVEFALLSSALRRDIPILAICRGMQLLNAHAGGTLYQNLATDMPGAIAHDFNHLVGRSQLIHDVTPVAGTTFADIVGTEKFMVNSLHHQGVKLLGNALVASATAPDGLIEGYEDPMRNFLIGVEWHPEELDDEPSRKLFEAFIASTKSGPR